jgi:hypothetical protein
VSQPRPVRFRHNAAITIAGIVAFIGALPLATSRVYLLPLLLAPLAVAVWGWRAGTDADAAGVRLRALLGSRSVGWDRIAGLAPSPDGAVHAVLAEGGLLRLPAVAPADLPRLVAASGRELETAPPPAA